MKSAGTGGGSHRPTPPRARAAGIILLLLVTAVFTAPQALGAVSSLAEGVVAQAFEDGGRLIFKAEDFGTSSAQLGDTSTFNLNASATASNRDVRASTSTSKPPGGSERYSVLGEGSWSEVLSPHAGPAGGEGIMRLTYSASGTSSGQQNQLWFHFDLREGSQIGGSGVNQALRVNGSGSFSQNGSVEFTFPYNQSLTLRGFFQASAGLGSGNSGSASASGGGRITGISVRNGTEPPPPPPPPPPVEARWTAGSGAWDMSRNWDVDAVPGAETAVFVAPATSNIAVSGPAAPTVVRSLEVGSAGGAGGRVNLQLQAAGTLVASAGMIVHPRSTLAGRGVIGGDLQVAGTLIPGDAAAPGALAVVGDVRFMPTASLDVRIAGSAASGAFGALTSDSSIALAGRLDVTLADASVRPPNSDTYRIAGGAITGAFQNASSGVAEAKYQSTGKTAGLFNVVVDEQGMSLEKFRQIHALSIGVDDTLLTQLNGAAAARLVDDAFTRLPGVASNTLLALDSTTIGRENVEQLRNQVATLQAKVAPGDTFVCLVSTHGTFDQSGANGRETSVQREIEDPVTGERTRHSATTTETEWTLSRVDSEKSITATKFRELFDDPRWVGVNKLFVLDTCYAGGFWSDPEGDPVVEYLSSLDHSAIIAASPHDLLSYANAATGVGYLSAAFAAAISDLSGSDHDLLSLVASIEVERDELFLADNRVIIQGGAGGAGTAVEVEALSPLFIAATPDFSLGLVGADAVPEPGSLAVLVLLGSGILRRRCRAARGGLGRLSEERSAV